jgi:hypothetical protein
MTSPPEDERAELNAFNYRIRGARDLVKDF